MIHARKDYNRIQDPAGKIGYDEPVFLLRAQDQLSSIIVREYAVLNQDRGGDPAITAMLYSHALLMDQWRNAHGGGKMPDLPEDYFNEG